MTLPSIVTIDSGVKMKNMLFFIVFVVLAFTLGYLLGARFPAFYIAAGAPPIYSNVVPGGDGIGWGYKSTTNPTPLLRATCLRAGAVELQADGTDHIRLYLITDNHAQDEGRQRDARFDYRIANHTNSATT